MSLVDKINATLLKLNVDLQLAKVPKKEDATSGETSGQTLQPTSGGTLPSVIVTEYVPKNVSVSYSAIGAPVMETKDGGKEAPAEDGDYETVAGKTITVKDGKLVSETDTPQEDIDEHSGDTKTTEMAKVVIPTLDLKAYPWEQCIADNTKKYGAESAKKICGKIKAMNMSVQDADELLAMATNKSDQLMAALNKAGIDLKKKGDYCINISVGEDGTISYGTLSTNTYENLLMAKEQELETEVNKLIQATETRLAQEKEKYEKLVEAHMHGIVPSKDKGAEKETKMSRTDVLKQQIASKIQSQE